MLVRESSAPPRDVPGQQCDERSGQRREERASSDGVMTMGTTAATPTGPGNPGESVTYVSDGATWTALQLGLPTDGNDWSPPPPGQDSAGQSFVVWDADSKQLRTQPWASNVSSERAIHLGVQGQTIPDSTWTDLVWTDLEYPNGVPVGVDCFRMAKAVLGEAKKT